MICCTEYVYPDKFICPYALKVRCYFNAYHFSVFGALVAITASSFLIRAHEAIAVGLVSGGIVVLTMFILERTMIDDPRAAFAVHGLCGFWGLLSVGVFGRRTEGLMEYGGLLHGEYYLFLVQLLTGLVIAVWAMVSTYIVLRFIDLITPIRAPLVNELLGADYSDHNILNAGAGVDEAVNILREYHNITEGLQATGYNLGHSMYLEKNYGNNNPQNQILDRTRLSLAFLFQSKDITNEDIITYSKGISSNASNPPRISEGGGVYGSNRNYESTYADRSPLYQDHNYKENA